MREVVDEVIEVIQQRADEDQRPVSFEVNAPESLPSVYGDVERVRQIVTNLIDNAYKYSPENSKVTINLFEAEDA
ncbi:MAG: hypothetical protein GWN87_05195, partial [Desulfuromonadales bacterium]|nr:hypothetical protein [Desulfuromonadales bacterium]